MAQHVTGLQLRRLPDGRDELTVTYGADRRRVVLYGTCLIHEPPLQPGTPLLWGLFMHAHPGTLLEWFAIDPEE